jgi:hypothetical protein
MSLSSFAKEEDRPNNNDGWMCNPIWYSFVLISLSPALLTSSSWARDRLLEIFNVSGSIILRRRRISWLESSLSSYFGHRPMRPVRFD